MGGLTMFLFRLSILALLVAGLAAAGCARQGTPASAADPTAAYWRQLADRVQEWNQQRRKDRDVKAVAEHCARIVAEIEALSIGGVDPEVVRHGKLLISVLRQDVKMTKQLNQLEQADNMESWAAQFTNS